jgi:hypothetical protein
MVGDNRQKDSNTAMPSSASGGSVDWECVLLLRIVRIVTPYDGVIEENKIKNTVKSNLPILILSDIQLCQKPRVEVKMLYGHQRR